METQSVDIVKVFSTYTAILFLFWISLLVCTVILYMYDHIRSSRKLGEEVYPTFRKIGNDTRYLPKLFITSGKLLLTVLFIWVLSSIFLFIKTYF